MEIFSCKKSLSCLPVFCCVTTDVTAWLAKVCRGAQLGQLILTDQRGCQQCMVSSSWTEGEKGAHGNDIYIPKYLLQVGSSALQYRPGHLPKAKSELTLLFPRLAHTHLVFPIKIPLSSSMSLLVFILFSSWPLGKGMKQGDGWVFGRYLQPLHKVKIWCYIKNLEWITWAFRFIFTHFLPYANFLSNLENEKKEYSTALRCKASFHPNSIHKYMIKVRDFNLQSCVMQI